MLRSEKSIWITIIAIEATLFVATRVVLSRYGADSFDAELIRTPVRLVIVAIYWMLFRHLLVSARLDKRQVVRPSFLLPIAAFLIVPLLVGDFSGMSPVSRSIYAAACIGVALREEVTFRGLIQNLLGRHMRVWQAICLTTFLATIWRIGVIPVFYFAYAQVVIVSLLLGIVYAKTRNLWLVVILHLFYDALWALTPIFGAPLLPYGYGLTLLGVALVATGAWAWTTLNSNEPGAPSAPSR
jgi:membrane protease YdiL (CAAX protease family)